MSAVSDFAAKIKVHHDKVEVSIDGLTGDSANLKSQIAALQASQGQITPEDQLLLDGIEATANTIAGKLADLDALTPPTPV